MPNLTYKPRKQFLSFHQRSTRWAILICHRRAGKTVAAVNELIIRALYTTKPNARYAYVAPFREQAKDIAFEYLKLYAAPFAEPNGIRVSELRVKLLNGAWITLYGSDNPDALRGRYFDGVVMDEYGDARPQVWGEIIRPTLADRHGWAVFIGTVKGKNHFWQVYTAAQNNKRWYSMMLKATESDILSAEELEDLRLEMSDDEFDQEFQCNPNAAIKGTYYAAQIAEMEKTGQIQEQDLYNDQEPVQVAADLGYKDSTAIWFWQNTPTGPVIIDYHEAQGEKPDYYFEMFDNKPYKYEEIWLPHDAKAETLSTSRSTLEQFQDHFRHQQVHIRKTPKLTKQQGIDALRLAMKFMRFDSRKTADGIEALRAYSRKYDSFNKIFLNTPKHNWASDGADGARYMALVCRLPKGELGRQVLDARAKSSVNGDAVEKPAIIPPFKPEPLTLQGLFDDNERKSARTFEKLRL